MSLQVAILMDLADFLADKVRATSLRDVGGVIGITHTGVDKIIKRQSKEPPQLETLVGIAKGYDVPLWNVIEMAGYDLGLPKEPNAERARLIDLAERIPELQELLGELLDLTDDQRRIAVGYIESYLRFQSEQSGGATPR